MRCTMEEFLGKVSDMSCFYGLKLLSAVLVFIIGKWIANLLAGILEKVMTKSKADQTLTKYTQNIVYFALMIFVVIMTLNKLGVQTTSFVAVIGAAGLAIGLALQGSLSNFAAGAMLVIFKPFQVGDSVEAGGVSGIVQEIQIFNSIFKTTDNKKVIVPNSKITADKITVIIK